MTHLLGGVNGHCVAPRASCTQKDCDTTVTSTSLSNAYSASGVDGTSVSVR
jgi:hypothetical protein